MQRIYLSNTKLGDTLCLTDPQIHHQLTRVLRSRIGDRVAFFDGKIPRDYIYTIDKIDKKNVYLSYNESFENTSTAKKELHLYQAMPNTLDKLEIIVQKATEIGYTRLVFFPSERSKKMNLSEAKQVRLNKIAIEATEQCLGNTIPELEFVDTTAKNLENSQVFVCHTDLEGGESLRSINNVENTIAVFVGPEGGWSPDEIQEFQQFGYSLITLGNRIFRTETVAPLIGFMLLQK